MTATLHRSPPEVDDRREGRGLGCLWARESATFAQLEDVATRTLNPPGDSAGFLVYLEWWLRRPGDHLAGIDSVRHFLAGSEGRPWDRWSDAFVEGFVEGTAQVYADVRAWAAAPALAAT